MKAKPNVVVFHAIGGAGKTALVNYWLNDKKRSPMKEFNEVLAISFAEADDRSVANLSNDFLLQCLAFFDDSCNDRFGKFQETVTLIKHLQNERTLLILDGFEVFLCPPGPNAGEIRDPVMRQVVRAIAAYNPGLCVITSKVPIADLNSFPPESVQQVHLSELQTAAAVTLLKDAGVAGPQTLLSNLVEQYHCHALSIKLLGSYIANAFAGDIKSFINSTSKLEESFHHLIGVTNEALKTAKILMWYQKYLRESNRGRIANDILKICSVSTRPVSMDAVRYVVANSAIPEICEYASNANDILISIALEDLCKWSLLIRLNTTQNIIEYELHPLIRLVISSMLQREHRPGWECCRKRLFEFRYSYTTQAISTLYGDSGNSILNKFEALIENIENPSKQKFYVDMQGYFNLVQRIGEVIRSSLISDETALKYADLTQKAIDAGILLRESLIDRCNADCHSLSPHDHLIAADYFCRSILSRKLGVSWEGFLGMSQNGPFCLGEVIIINEEILFDIKNWSELLPLIGYAIINNTTNILTHEIPSVNGFVTKYGENGFYFLNTITADIFAFAVGYLDDFDTYFRLCKHRPRFNTFFVYVWKSMQDQVASGDKTTRLGSIEEHCESFISRFAIEWRIDEKQKILEMATDAAPYLHHLSELFEKLKLSHELSDTDRQGAFLTLVGGAKSKICAECPEAILYLLHTNCCDLVDHDYGVISEMFIQSLLDAAAAEDVFGGSFPNLTPINP